MVVAVGTLQWQWGHEDGGDIVVVGTSQWWWGHCGGGVGDAVAVGTWWWGHGGVGDLALVLGALRWSPLVLAHLGH